jgi:hypothetical protein
MPHNALKNGVQNLLTSNNEIDDLTDVINIENPTRKQRYVFKTMLGWAEQNNITPRNLHVDGTIEDENGEEHNSPVDQVPVESKEQLIVLADLNGNLDKIFYSKKGEATGRNITEDFDPCEGIELSSETEITDSLTPHITRK